jgi:formate-dependent nitrite reductase membrane component NrfD
LGDTPHLLRTQTIWLLLIENMFFHSFSISIGWVLFKCFYGIMLMGILKMFFRIKLRQNNFHIILSFIPSNSM